VTVRFLWQPPDVKLGERSSFLILTCLFLGREVMLAFYQRSMSWTGPFRFSRTCAMPFSSLLLKTLGGVLFALIWRWFTFPSTPGVRTSLIALIRSFRGFPVPPRSSFAFLLCSDFSLAGALPLCDVTFSLFPTKTRTPLFAPRRFTTSPSYPGNVFPMVWLCCLQQPNERPFLLPLCLPSCLWSPSSSGSRRFQSRAVFYFHGHFFFAFIFPLNSVPSPLPYGLTRDQVYSDKD